MLRDIILFSPEFYMQSPINRYFLIWILFTIVVFSSCSISKPATAAEGEVVYQIKIFDTISHIYENRTNYFPAKKVLYRDSILIEEIVYIDFRKVNDEPEIITTKVLNYTLIDLKNRNCYEYRNFSDTAALVKKYKLPDSAWITGGTVYTAKRSIEYTEIPKELKDTAIENVDYKRTLFINNRPNDLNPSKVAYFRCDKRGSIFNLFSLYLQRDNCPIVRVDLIPSEKNPVPPSGQTKFVRNKLTKLESAIFDTWIKNAKQNPVE